MTDHRALTRWRNAFQSWFVEEGVFVERRGFDAAFERQHRCKMSATIARNANGSVTIQRGHCSAPLQPFRPRQVSARIGSAF
jgi:hypothetical protein